MQISPAAHDFSHYIARDTCHINKLIFKVAVSGRAYSGLPCGLRWGHSSISGEKHFKILKGATKMRPAAVKTDQLIDKG